MRGIVGLMRGEVLRGDGVLTMRTRSVELAEVVARLLDGEQVEGREVDDRALIPRYQLSHGAGADRVAIVGIESSTREGSRFGDGILALTDDETLAERVTQMLNQVDPRRRPRARRGIGWW
jgi:hypothetical protein